MSRHVGSRLELLDASFHGAGNGSIPVSRHVAFEVMWPSARRTTSRTDMGLVV